MKIKSNLSKLILGIVVIGSLQSMAVAADSCPTVVDNGTEVSLSFTSAGLDNLIKFGYGGTSNNSSIEARGNSFTSSAIIPVGEQSFFLDYIFLPFTCTPSAGECLGNGQIQVGRYRTNSDVAFVSYLVGETPVTAVVNLSGAPTVTCHDVGENFNFDVLIASFDLTSATEVFALSSNSDCPETESVCPIINPNSILTSDTGGGENFRGPIQIIKAENLAKRALRTGGLENRKKLLARAIKQLNAFVSSTQYRSSSASLRNSVKKNLKLAVRAVKRSAGTKLVHAALIALKGS